MSGIQLDTHPAGATRKQDISSWKKGNISKLTSGEKKRYYRRQSAIQAYFTTDTPLEEIAQQFHIPIENIDKLVKQCLALHKDGTPWGYRALLPGAQVVDHTPTPTPAPEHTPLPEVPATPAEAEETPIVPTDTDAHKAALFLDAENGPSDGIQVDDEQEDTAMRLAVRRAQVAHRSIEPRTDPVVAAFEEIQPDDQREIPAPDGATTGEDAAILEDTSVLVTDDTALVALDDIETPPAIEAAHLDSMAVPEMSQARAEPEKSEETTKAGEATEATEPAEHSEHYPYIYKGYQPATTPELGREVTAFLSEVSALVEEPVISRHVGSGRRYRIPGARVRLTGAVQSTAQFNRRLALARRAVRKNWARQNERTRRSRMHKVIAAVVVAALLITLVVPLAAGLAAYNTYNSIRSEALDGVAHLMSLKSLLSVAKSDPTAVLNAQKLQQARSDLGMAQSDFLQLQQLVAQPGIQQTVQQYAPQYTGKLGMAQRLVQVGLDVTQMGTELIGVASLGANILHGSPLVAGSTKPLITPSDMTNVEAVLAHSLYYINDIQAQMSQVKLSDLPISASQQQELASVMTLLPKVQGYVQQGQSLIGLVSWLLGVGQERRFLVQTMDSAELRPGGGFTGQYGILDIKDGRMAPFTLQDVTELDYAGNGQELGRQAPSQYRMWMNFGNWGLRDSNLSGDFPTTAQLAMGVFQDEGGGPVDGDIAFTPVVISHILDVIGPVQVPEYNETITAQNLEDKLHYYQQNFSAIAIQQQKTGTHNAATRKAFTTLLGKILLQKVEHLPVKTLLKIAQNATKDIQSRDLEIYFNNPQAEAWLTQHGYSDAMSTFTNQDGFMVVQANISISKASQYVQTTYQDNIALDPQGGATHTLTITLNYQQTGPVYGQDTYADYIRVYAPQNAQFLSGDGFDTGQALCTPSSPGGTGNKPPPTQPPTGTGTPPSTGCSQYANSFPSNARYCPNGNYNLTGPNSFVPGKGFMPWPIDALGAPTEMTSDLPGRSMWGGLTVTPKNCISTITLSWYVPNVVRHVAGQPLYSVLVQKQGGYIPAVQITIDTSQLQGVKPYNYSGNLLADRIFALAAIKKS